MEQKMTNKYKFSRRDFFKLAGLIFAGLTLSACGVKETESPIMLPVNHPFDYYGWFYVLYGERDNDLAEIAEYMNTAFATSPEQVKLLKAHKFEHIIFVFNESAILEGLWKNEGRNAPDPAPAGVLFYDNEVPNFRKKFFIAYQQYMEQLKDSLIAAGVYDQIDVYYIADEPALHRNVYRDQDFLDQYVDEFHNVFQGKKSAITFAENKDPENLYPGTGPHYNPPEHLDLVAVDPYFIDPKTGAVDLPCERTAIRDWLYKDNSFSNINWAKQFKKPIIVIGDAQLKADQPPKDCYVLETYSILKEDPAVVGLVWFIYDKEYEEGDYLRGAANNPSLVELIETLGR